MHKNRKTDIWKKFLDKYQTENDEPLRALCDTRRLAEQLTKEEFTDLYLAIHSYTSALKAELRHTMYGNVSERGSTLVQETIDKFELDFKARLFPPQN